MAYSLGSRLSPFRFTSSAEDFASRGYSFMRIVQKRSPQCNELSIDLTTSVEFNFDLVVSTQVPGLVDVTIGGASSFKKIGIEIPIGFLKLDSVSRLRSASAGQASTE